PEKTERDKDIAKWLAKQEAIETGDDDVDLQTEYIRELVDRTDYPDFDLEKVTELFKEWLRDKAEGILSYRDKNFTSGISGTKAEPHHTKWLAELDDSMERYLATADELAAKKKKAS